MKNLLAAALAAVLFCASAHAAQAPETSLMTGPSFQQVPSSQILLNLNGTPTTLAAALGSACGVSPTGCTSAGPATFSGGSSLILGSGTPAILINGGGGFKQQVTIDPSTLSGPTYWHYNITTLNPSTATGNAWQNDQSYITLNGPGSTTGELIPYHAHFQITSGVTSAGSIEGLESSINIAGTTNVWAGALAVPSVLPTGTVTGGLYGTKVQLNQQNTTSGAVAQFAALDVEAMTGGGSTPTGYFSVRVADPNASISTLGGVNIGSLAAANNPGTLTVNGPDTLSSTCPVLAKNSSGQTILQACDDRTVGLATIVNVGLAGTWGRINFANTTSGAVQLNAPSSGALGSAVLTLPDVTGTVAAFATGALSQGGLTTWTNTQPCTAGQITWDANAIYICTAANTVKKATLSTF